MVAVLPRSDVSGKPGTENLRASKILRKSRTALALSGAVDRSRSARGGDPAGKKSAVDPKSGADRGRRSARELG